jgi:beta-glucosidase
MAFPKDFIWGCATSSYQIEGGALTEGRGECIWYRFSHTPGKILNGDTGDLACDHLHRYQDDVRLMKWLGMDAYRFSVAWARVLPQGTGTPNEQGIDFYNRLVDELLAHDIKPYLTLYHWDLPQALQDQGGWESRDSRQWFTEYADLMTRRLGDRVKVWTTINEPWVVAFLGNCFGTFAPGKQDINVTYKVAHNLILAHACAVPVIRQNVPDGEVGITLDFTYTGAVTDDPADQAAAQREWDAKNTWFADMVFKGSYPTNMVEWLGDALAGIDLSEASQMAVPLDFLGVNYYTRNMYKHSDYGLLKSEFVEVEGLPRTDFCWEIYPDGLRNVLVWLHETYHPKALYVTENGAAYDDPAPAADVDVVEDASRVAYYQTHLNACQQAIEKGVPLKGYFAWSLFDNFEWAVGYSKRFGIVYVDYGSQRRVPKRSGLMLREMIHGKQG